MIVGLVLQQSLSLGLIAYLIALVIGNLTYEKWPRRVLVGPPDQLLCWPSCWSSVWRRAPWDCGARCRSRPARP